MSAIIALFIAIAAFIFMLSMIWVTDTLSSRPSRSESIVLSFKRFKTLYELKPEDWDVSSYCEPKYKMKGMSRWDFPTPVYFENIFDILRYQRWQERKKHSEDIQKQLSIQQKFISVVNERLRTEKEMAREQMESAIAAYEKIKEGLNER